MFFLSTILNLISSYLIASLGGSFLIIFVAFFAFVILNIEILSIFSAIKDTNILIFSFLNLFFSLALFKIKKASFLIPQFNFKRFKNALLLDKTLIILLCAFVTLTIISFFLATIMPAIEPDSQTYHFIRAYMFFKQQTLSHFETNDVRALIMPINSEIFYTWMLSFKKNFYGYGILSFASFFVVISSMWNIFEKFKFAYRKRLYAIFIFSSLSAVIIQIPSLQTDIVVGAFLLLGFYLFIDKKTYFSALCIALAMGIKSTGIIALIGFFVLIFLYLKLIEKEKNYKQIKLFFIFLCVNFIAFSSYNYILNFIHYNNPLGNTAAILGHSFWGGIKGYIANLIHFSFQGLDFTGFTWGYHLNQKILNLKEAFFNLIHINPIIGCNVSQKEVNIITDEQTVGFGILGFLVFIPTIFISIYNFFKAKKPKNKKIILCFIFSVTFLINILVLARSVAYMVYSIRFVVAFVCLSSIILISVYKKKSFYRPIILFFCLFYMFLIPAHNVRAPFWEIYKNFKALNFDKKIFSEKCFEGEVVRTMKFSPVVIKTIKAKYSDKKNIALIKTLKTTALYLKTLEFEGIKIDFLNAGLLNKEKLKNYDLIILEDDTHNDNIFSPDEVNPQYEIKENSIVFKDSKALNCIYTHRYYKKTPYIDEAIERTCFTLDFIKQQNNLKKDYSETFERDNKNDIVTIYYFTNQNVD